MKKVIVMLFFFIIFFIIFFFKGMFAYAGRVYSAEPELTFCSGLSLYLDKLTNSSVILR